MENNPRAVLANLIFQEVIKSPEAVTNFVCAVVNEVSLTDLCRIQMVLAASMKNTIPNRLNN